MRPYIICHMMMSLDGRINCAMTEKIDNTNNYYEVLESLDCPSHLSGKTTMAMHNALPGIFEPKEMIPLGWTAFHKATYAPAYTISVDTKGSLLWDNNIVEDLPLICVVSEQVSNEYLRYLEGLGISWIAVGENAINLPEACELLNREFGVKRLAVVGGGHINGSFLNAGLIDEVSMMIGPAIDGRSGFAAAFDGLPLAKNPTLMKLTSVEKYDNDTVWLRYTMKMTI